MSFFKRESEQPSPKVPSHRQALSTTDLPMKPTSPAESEQSANTSSTAPVPVSSLAMPEFDQARESAAVLDRNTRIQGTLQSDGNVLIEGSFDGDMEALETIMVEQEASVKGHLLANDVIVSGLFDGEAVCQHRFRVTPGGRVAGQINTQVLVVEEGSTVNCRFTMTREGRQF